MKLKTATQCLTVVAYMLSTVLAFSQQPLDIAKNYIRQHHQEWNLTEQDISDMKVSDM